MQPTSDLVVHSPVRDKARLIVVVVALPAALLAVLLLAGLGRVAPVSTTVLVAVAALWLGWGAFATLTGAPPALTAAGIRLRPRPTRRADTTVPWSDVRSLALVPITGTSRVFLRVTTTDPAKYPGPRKDGVNLIYLPRGAVSPQQVKDAVHGFTNGWLVVREEPPQRSPAGRR